MILVGVSIGFWVATAVMLIAISSKYPGGRSLANIASAALWPLAVPYHTFVYHMKQKKLRSADEP